MNINVHIDRLVLDEGTLQPADAAALQVAVERELTRRLRDHGLNGITGYAVPVLSAGRISPAVNGAPARTGEQIARAVHSALTPTPAQGKSGGRR